MTSYDRQRLRLKQEPIDEWSTQEKLALATGVKKIGNQNWGPIVRQLKSFAEKDRPSDWFNQKYCALQYNEMFDKIEAPKRKRGERGEETTQDLIVKKYTTERLQELEQGMKEKFEQIVNLRKILKKLKSSDYDEEYLRQLTADMREKEQKKKDAEEQHKKWLAEREMKLSQISMKFRVGATPIVRQPTGKNDVISAKEKSINNDKIVETSEKETDNEMSDNNLVDDNKPKQDAANDQPATVKEQNQVKILSPKTENNSEDYPSSDNTNLDKTENVEPVNEITDEILENNQNETKVNTNVIESIEESDSTSSSCKGNNDNNDVVNNEPTISSIIKADIMNDESCETNETVFEDSVSPNENRIDDNRIISIDELQKITSELKNDSQNESSMDVIDNVSITKENDDQASIKIDSDNNDDKNMSKNRQQSIDQSIDDSTVSSNDRSGRRKRRRTMTPSTNNHVIQTRSTRSSAHSESQIESTIIKKDEEIPKPIASKKRTPSTNDESSNQFVNYSEESNDSKSMISEQVTATIINENDIKWKKASSAIIRAIQNHRLAAFVLKPFENNNEYRDAIIQDVDLNATKKRIENGQIHSEAEFKRDLMLMFTNGIILNTEPNIIKGLIEFAKEIMELFEASETVKIKTRDKYNNTIEVEKNSRRLTRGSINMIAKNHLDQVKKMLNNQ